MSIESNERWNNFESFDPFAQFKYNIEGISKMLEHLVIGDKGKKSDEFLFLHGYVSSMLVKPRTHCTFAGAKPDEICGKSEISKFQRINASSIENVADETLFTFEKSSLP